MGRRIFIDIETLPPGEDARRLLEGGPLCRFHEDGFRRAGTAPPSLEERFRRLALCGEHGRVLAVGVIDERDGQIVCRGVLGRERETLRFHLDEARSLRAFWRFMSGFDPRRDTIVGHNVLDFDLPFLYKRSIIHSVPPSVRLSFARYRSQPVYDTMWEWVRWSRERVSLDRLARALGLRSSKADGIDGAHVYDLFRAGSHEEIADYCIRDVELVRSIYYRMEFSAGPTDEPLASGR
ncbi:MAG TPA: ribonuclease H-like domain-containing protein [Pyrinomonadaceae bacterium]|jgi:hypothetical protein